MKPWILIIAAIALAACGRPDGGSTDDAADAAAAAEPAAAAVEDEARAASPDTGTPPPEAKLVAALDAQPDDAKARYPFRHPRETLEFFGIRPGMTVLEGLPGGGWYTRILLPYLGDDGKLIGVDYALDMWPKFGMLSDEQLEAKAQWPETWSVQAIGWRGSGETDIEAYTFASLPEALNGTVDAALMIRSLHNLARFEDDGGYLTQACEAIYRVLKPGGVLGVVQHEAPADAADEWANGSRGYLKKAFVIAAMEGAGFEFVGESDVNANPNDQPGESDFVWRLPPTLATSGDDEALRKAMLAIGESNRMTLKFRKPG